MELTFRTIILAAMLAFTGQASGETPADSWPGFRGDGSSASSATGLPLSWSAEKNIAWTAPLAGVGQSSPVIHRGAVYTTSVSGANKETLHIQRFDLATGEEEWSREFESSAPEELSDYRGKAAPTPVVDDRAVYAFFESGDLVAIDPNGTKLWQRSVIKEFGPIEGNHGLGSSPTQTETSVIVVVDHEGQSYIAAFDKTDGSLLWKTDRDTGVAWASPMIADRNGSPTVLVSAAGAVAAYAPDTGEALWSFEGVTGNNVPSASISHDWLIVASNRKGGCAAIRLDGTDAPSTTAWKSSEASSSFGSPLAHGGRAYFVNRAGVLFCHSLETGDLLFDARLPDSTWASPLAIRDRICFFSTDGTTTVIKAADEFKVLAENKLELEENDRVYGFAAADATIVLRTGQKLTAIRNQ